MCLTTSKYSILLIKVACNDMIEIYYKHEAIIALRVIYSKSRQLKSAVLHVYE